MPLTIRRPITASTAQMKSRPIGESFEVLLDEVGAEAQREHQQRREHEEDLALRRRQDVAGDVLNPAVGAELDRADQRVGDEQHEQQHRADGEVGLDADDQQQREGDRPGEVAPGRRGEERIRR